MKFRQLMVIGCLSIIVAGCSTAHRYCRQNSCNFQSECEVFGNIGGKYSDMSDAGEAYRYESYDSAEAYFSNYVNGDISPVPHTSYKVSAPSRAVPKSYKMHNFKGQ